MENIKNDYKLKDNFLFNKNGLYGWPGEFDEAFFALQQAPYSSNKEHLLKEEPLSESLENKTQNWTFEIFVKSALYCFLQEKINERMKNKENSLEKYDWVLIFPLMLNSSINKEIILFIEESYKVPYNFLIVAAHFSIKRLFLFNQLIISKKSLNDFLIFLKIDLVSREFLVEKTFREHNFDQLADFLFAIDSSLNQNLILLEVLENYKYFIKNDNFYFDLKKIEIKVTQLLELSRDNLQTFSVFDMFESSEIAKSKGSEIIFFSFYENLLNNSNDDISEDFLEIFRLFEQFLHASKDKSILLANISFDKSSQFYRFVESFYFIYQEKIKRILKRKSKLILKFRKAGIDYETLAIASLFAFIALLNILGVKSDKPRFSVSPTPEGCFATITSNFGQGVKVSRVNRENEPGYSMNVAAPVQRVNQEGSLGLTQPRPMPRNTTLSASRSRTGATIYSKSSLVTAPQKGIKVILLGELSFNGLSAADCIDLLQHNIQEKFPGSFVTVRSTFGKINSVYQEMSEITVTGSVGQFGRLETIKDTVVDGVGYTKGTLLSAHFGQIERDHVLNNVTRGLFDITDERAAAVFVERFLHTRIGDNRTYLVPDGLGYTPGTGGSLTLIDHFCEQDMINIQQNSENPKFANFLESVNLTPEELQESYKKAFELDRLLVNNRMGDDMDENVHLAMSQDTYLNKKTAEELNSLSDRLSRNKNQDGKAAARSVERILQAAQARRDHTHAVKNFVQEGTRAYHTIVKYENRALNAAKELIAQVEFMHGKVDPAVVARFESKTPSNILSPEQAYNEAAVSQGLKNLKNKPKTFAGPGRFIPNYPT